MLQLCGQEVLLGRNPPWPCGNLNDTGLLAREQREGESWRERKRSEIIQICLWKILHSIFGLCCFSSHFTKTTLPAKNENVSLWICLNGELLRLDLQTKQTLSIIRKLWICLQASICESSQVQVLWFDFFFGRGDNPFAYSITDCTFNTHAHTEQKNEHQNSRNQTCS